MSKKIVRKASKKKSPKPSKKSASKALIPQIIGQKDKEVEDDERDDFDIEEVSGEEITPDFHYPVESHKDEDWLPVNKASNAFSDSTDPLTRYVREINRYELLTIDEERALTKALSETGDIEVAKKLVLANLRLVVKIALEYRRAYANVMDLIQEGNIGLMKAVSKYDSTKGAKLSYYASWWIRSYILKFILDNFRLVKLGTTNDQKKLFFNLLKEKNRLVSLGIDPDNKTLSENLGVSEKSVALMDQRLGPGSGDLSLDTPLRNEEGESGSTIIDTFADSGAGPDEKLAHDQEVKMLSDHLGGFLTTLKDRDQEIFKNRLLSEAPMSLQAIADQYGVSRERIRQIEERLIHSLKVYMSKIIR